MQTSVWCWWKLDGLNVTREGLVQPTRFARNWKDSATYPAGTKWDGEAKESFGRWTLKKEERRLRCKQKFFYGEKSSVCTSQSKSGPTTSILCGNLLNTAGIKNES